MNRALGKEIDVVIAQLGLRMVKRQRAQSPHLRHVDLARGFVGLGIEYALDMLRFDA